MDDILQRLENPILFGITIKFSILLWAARIKVWEITYVKKIPS
jgi:hypothetical protein